MIALHLTNFTIIDELSLEFNSGMTVLTGETGAGKSIIIDAIQLALGERLDAKIVREGCEKSTIALTFDISENSFAKSWLIEKELQADNECILQRTISQEGKSRAFINGIPTTLQLLSELGALLINIQGQHQQRTLVKKDVQLEIIDQYGQHAAYLSQIAVIAQKWQDTKKRYDILIKKSEDTQSQSEFLRFQLAEFEQLALRDNEVEELDQEHKLLSNSEKLLTHCHAVSNIIAENNQSTQQQLSQCLRHLEDIKSLSSNLSNAYDLLTNAVVHVDEAYDEIKRYQQHIDLNPARLSNIETRLSAIHAFSRKHRIPSKELKSLETKLLQDLHALENTDSHLSALKDQLSDLENQYQSIAKQLTSARINTAAKLNHLITRDMQLLNMQGGVFEIALLPIQECIPNALGQERAEFLVSANTGQRLQPLAKVASGGELSRISLAIQVNTAKMMQTPALIFDEIDTGIGGATADIVGHLLQKLSHETQVFCITHLPQVASKASHHLKVEKYIKHNQTFTTVRSLTKSERIDEIARMLGGITVTQESLDHAKVLLLSS